MGMNYDNGTFNVPIFATICNARKAIIAIISARRRRHCWGIAVK